MESIDKSDVHRETVNDFPRTEEDGKQKAMATAGRYSYWSLYTGADTFDTAAITVGCVGAVVNGATLPMFTFYFGEVRLAYLLVTLPQSLLALHMALKHLEVSGWNWCR